MHTSSWEVIELPNYNLPGLLVFSILNLVIRFTAGDAVSCIRWYKTSDSRPYFRHVFLPQPPIVWIVQPGYKYLDHQDSRCRRACELQSKTEDGTSIDPFHRITKFMLHNQLKTSECGSPWKKLDDIKTLMLRAKGRELISQFKLPY